MHVLSENSRRSLSGPFFLLFFGTIFFCGHFLERSSFVVLFLERSSSVVLFFWAVGVGAGERSSFVVLFFFFWNDLLLLSLLRSDLLLCAHSPPPPPLSCCCCCLLRERERIKKFLCVWKSKTMLSLPVLTSS